MAPRTTDEPCNSISVRAGAMEPAAREAPRPARAGPRFGRAAAAAVLSQFWTGKPGTRENSATSSVTRVRPSARACAAIIAEVTERVRARRSRAMKAKGRRTHAARAARGSSGGHYRHRPGTGTRRRRRPSTCPPGLPPDTRVRRAPPLAGPAKNEAVSSAAVDLSPAGEAAASGRARRRGAGSSEWVWRHHREQRSRRLPPKPSLISILSGR